jgi:DNA replication protein DnaC
METQKQEIKQLCSKFMLTGMGENLEGVVTDAEKQGMGFMQFTLTLLQSEVTHRQSKDEARRLKAAGLPRSTNLGQYDAEKNGLKTERLAQLRELNWIDQLFNMVLPGCG